MKISPWKILLVIFLFILWIVAGVYSTISSIKITPTSGLDLFLTRAYWTLFSAAFITWGLIAVFVILVILAITGVVAFFGSGAGVVAAEGAEMKAAQSAAQGDDGITNAIVSSIPWITIILLIVALVLVITTGVLCAIAAHSMTKSNNFKPKQDPEQKSAYTNSIIAAVLCLGTAGLLFVIIVTYFIVSWKHKKDEEHKKQEYKNELEETLTNIKKLRLMKQEQKSLTPSTREKISSNVMS